VPRSDSTMVRMVTVPPERGAGSAQCELDERTGRAVEHR
jgi:hypothetical protein